MLVRSLEASGYRSTVGSFYKGWTELNQAKPKWRTIPELRSCVKVEVAVLGSPPLKVLMVSVDVR